MDTTTLLAVLGPVVALAVSFLKKVPFVATNPKLVAAGISLVVAAIGTFAAGVPAGAFASALLNIALSALVGTASAVTTYEVAKPR